jgi:hypothetical protein
LKKVAEALPKINVDALSPGAVAKVLDGGCQFERLAPGDDTEDSGFASVTITVNRREGRIEPNRDRESALLSTTGRNNVD